VLYIATLCSRNKNKFVCRRRGFQDNVFLKLENTQSPASEKEKSSYVFKGTVPTEFCVGYVYWVTTT
jgi:hypothetical protein